MTSEQLPSVLTVRQVTAYIKRLFDRDELLQDVIVRGEVSNVKWHRSGHLYFTLKDEEAAIDCVCFRNVASTIGFDVDTGMQVVAAGRVTVYEKQGRYQLIVFLLRPDGVGALHAAFERLRAKLEAEGLFDASRKRPLPRFPRCIALVTSPTGAAVRDLTTIISRRYPPARIIIFPTLVQGEGAPESIVASLRAADAEQAVDLIIFGRGGGSLEDLWAFNDERVARAIFACRKPTVSAVGHETDVTIADLVADVRAPTPSAAAEIAVPDRAELLQHLESLGKRALSALAALTQRARTGLVRLNSRTPLRTPTFIIEQWFLRTDEAAEKIAVAMELMVERAAHRLRLATTRLDTHRPEGLIASRRERLTALLRRAEIGLIRTFERPRGRLLAACSALKLLHPRNAVALRLQKYSHISTRAATAAAHLLANARWRLRRLSAQLDALNPRGVLERGYSITLRLPEQTVVCSASQVQPADYLRILLAHGELQAETRCVTQHDNSKASNKDRNNDAF